MKLLKSAPLLEAVCEIVFMPSSNYDLTIPGVLYAELKNEFPNKDVSQLQLPLTPLIDPKSGNLDILQTGLTRFFSHDSNKIVQVGKDILAMNHTTNYGGWEEFRDQISRVFGIYSNNIGTSLQIRQITLKYVNKFDLENGRKFEEVFNFSMPNPYGDAKPLRAFVTHLDFDGINGDILSKAVKTIHSSNPAVTSVVLEITNLINIPGTINPDDLVEWLNNAHASISELFNVSLNKDYLKSIE